MQLYSSPSFADTNKVIKLQKILPEVDSIYKEYAEKNHFPGYAYGIIVDGGLIHSGSGGFIDLEKKIPATSQSMFRIASMTKSFTAMAILKLRDENKLRLDDPVHLYIPEIQNLKLTEDSPIITIRDLLIHLAGFSTDDPWADRKLEETENELLEFLKKGVFLSNVPGTVFEYSNLGYALLGYIIKKVTNTPFGKFITESLCEPLGMQDVSWDFGEISPSKLVHGYRWEDNHWIEESLLKNGIFGAMGGMITSVESFSRYVALHLSAWPPRNDCESGPIKRSSLREMHLPWNFRELLVEKCLNGQEHVLTKGYGYGLNWSKDGLGRVVVGHSGGLPGFGCNWSIMPEYGIALILFANVTYAAAGKLNLEILDKLTLAGELKPRQLPSSSILKTRKNDLVKFLPDWNNAFNSGVFADNFFLDRSIDSLKNEAVELFKKAGTIISISELVPENQLRGSFIIKCEILSLYVKFALTPENPPLIQEYHIKPLV
ncbi:MAG: beta-lactamase family protein [Parachlamydiaceae bacterium]|nr:beta-lactamase family protein [Parachlamydiaceae bacterium]